MPAALSLKSYPQSLEWLLRVGVSKTKNGLFSRCCLPVWAPDPALAVSRLGDTIWGKVERVEVS